MTKIKIFVHCNNFHAVNKTLKDSGVKFYPFRKIGSGYHMEFEPADHPLITFLLLKYDQIEILN
jgi:hypothetical protein